MSIFRQVCPFHADEDVQGIPTGSDDSSVTFTCARTRGHPHGGPHSWLYVPQPEGPPGLDGYAAELGLATELPAAIAQYRGQWIEYGVAERAYALQCSTDFATIVHWYGHSAVSLKQYTASAFLAGVLGVLSKQGTVLYHLGPATGRWKYNGTTSWWAIRPHQIGSPPVYRGPTAARTCPMYRARRQADSDHGRPDCGIMPVIEDHSSPSGSA
jgi:hypothetical protein